MNADLKKLMGARILSEANDLKRTITALAQEIQVDEQTLKNVVEGKCEWNEMNEVINRMGKCYPIDQSEFYFIEDDTTHGVRIMKEEESLASSRIFDRKDKNGDRTPFYEYRDTAMSKLGPFKPEWIKELRVVDNNDPYNPDIAYNNGHFLHQMTFFIGPVNFYWEVNGKKYCAEMNTGDSNYITPFWPHSFASRDKNQMALIIAVTYGGDVRRAQKEFYTLGPKNILNYKLEADDHAKATVQLIRQHMKNENLTEDNLMEIIAQRKKDLDIKHVLDEQAEKTLDQLQDIAECLNVELSDLLLSKAVKGNEVIVRKKDRSETYFFPNPRQKLYAINPLARCSKMPLMKGFDIEVLGEECDLAKPLVTSLHSYVYNYGKATLRIKWEKDGNTYENELKPSDSMYIQPFVKHAFVNSGKDHGQLCVVRVSGAVNLSTQKELSYFADINRVIESKCWFD